MFIMPVFSSEKVSFYLLGIYKVCTLHSFVVQVSSYIQIVEHKKRYILLSF